MFNKQLAKRLSGKIKQNKFLPYKFHISISHGGFGRTRSQVFEKLINDLLSFSEKKGVKIDISKFDNFFYAELVVRDHNAIQFFLDASNSRYKNIII